MTLRKVGTAMLLETNRLVILTTAEPSFDNEVRTVVCINGIFKKPNGITAEKLQQNPTLLSKLGSPIGLISLGQNGWIDYLILPEHQHNGYAAEALEAVKKFTIEKHVNPFLAIDNDNIASIAVAEKCGFKRVSGSDKQGIYYVG